jgi:DNA replication protein DnaC
VDTRWTDVDRGLADPESTLAGRDEELRRLAELVDGVHKRGGGLVIRGDAGIGKSALLAAASSCTRDRGVRAATSAPSRFCLKR